MTKKDKEIKNRDVNVTMLIVQQSYISYIVL